MGVACSASLRFSCDVAAASMTFAGEEYTVLLRQDGSAVCCARVLSAVGVPRIWTGGITYMQVSTGAIGRHIVLLRSDGRAAASGDNEYDKCVIPTIEDK